MTAVCKIHEVKVGVTTHVMWWILMVMVLNVKLRIQFNELEKYIYLGQIRQKLAIMAPSYHLTF